MRARTLAALAVLLLCTAGCSLLSPQPDRTRYAVLSSVDELAGGKPPPETAANPLRIGLGPIELPDYLLRTALVTRSGTGVSTSTTEHWAEPFDRSVERLLAIDLKRELGSAPPRIHPWYETDKPQLQIQFVFTRCERDANDKVVIACSWSALWLDASRPNLEREVRLERPVAGKDGSATAKAISEALAELCAEIGSAVRDTAPAPANGG